MSGTEERLTPVEQHLGDRLAALVDGELSHDARERVLAHLATCRSCKAEADAQRRLKNVFADTAPPPPSDGLLARLQGLPAGAGPPSADGPGDPPAGGGLGRRGAPSALRPGGSGRSAFRLDQLPAGRGVSALTPDGGFRIHRAPDAERPASRGRRFAFVAASAFSLAALALGGAVNAGSLSGSAVAGGERGSSTASAGSGASAAGEREARRRPAGSRAGGSTRGLAAPTAQATTSAGSRSSLSTQAGRGTGVQTSAEPGSEPLLIGGSAFTPSLIRQSALPRLVPPEKRLPLGAIPGRVPAETSPPVEPVPAPTPAVSAAGPLP
ncbi:anti-sigma factor [Streptomyces sp. JJ36]|uniref:anti-sigma factor family protein n=1 Tax=Streptomyces sp. JJ36 TaxID=2736645 RepID=UPI001F38C1A8|nr:anti-sigma factor [Streptomyces sp. JJ36]MCF6525539.1 zf-HC2 domain-containing protein [Streptomyces sp. JJ36]